MPTGVVMELHGLTCSKAKNPVVGVFLLLFALIDQSPNVKLQDPSTLEVRPVNPAPAYVKVICNCVALTEYVTWMASSRVTTVEKSVPKVKSIFPHLENQQVQHRPRLLTPKSYQFLPMANQVVNILAFDW